MGLRYITFAGFICVSTQLALVSAADANPSEQWSSAHFKGHPLVGTIWSATGERVVRAELRAAVTKANYVLLGEVHNNPDHHRLQERILQWLLASGRKPTVVVEMIPMSMQAKLDDYRQNGSTDAKELGARLRWAERGWPDWEMYQPIFATALSANLKIRAGGIARSRLRAISKKERFDRMAGALGLQATLNDNALAALKRTIKVAHCNLLPDSAIEPMINVQRARDLRLSKSVLSSDPTNGAILIAGSVHARRDWGVADIIRQNSPDARTVAIRFVEVAPKLMQTEDYSTAVTGLRAPFDFIFFTPRADLTDHCEKMKKHMNRSRQHTR